MEGIPKVEEKGKSKVTVKAKDKVSSTENVGSVADVYGEENGLYLKCNLLFIYLLLRSNASIEFTQAIAQGFAEVPIACGASPRHTRT